MVEEFPLKMGPVKNEWSDSLDSFLSTIEPCYKTTEGDSFDDEQMDGEDPLLEVEAITGKKGKGNGAPVVKWYLGEM